MKYLKPNDLVKPTWRDIYDTDKYPTYMGHVDNYIPIVHTIGYILICFNDLIWELDEGHFKQTGYRARDISGGKDGN